MEPLTLFTNNKERKWFFSLLLFIFLFNLFLHYQDFKNFTKNEIFSTTGIIINIYKKEKYDVLKIETKNFSFFTSIPKNNDLTKFSTINIFIVSKNIDFISYLKGFYAKSFNVNTIDTTNITNKEKLYRQIASQHANEEITSLYAALYLATPLNSQIRDLSAQLGISHLIAISGFHLGVMSFVLYFFINTLYSPFHTRLFPFRNKRFDIMIIVTLLLFAYLLFVDIPASLLRAFIMFIFALFLLRNNIKIISFETLFIVSVIIIALFPKLLFSLSLWFSISGVFYIFLFLKYFQNTNKYLQIVLFNFWIYMAMNPITHYFFGTVSKEQLFSPIATLLFTLFYPVSVLLHFLNIGGLVDYYIQYVIDLDIYSVEVFSPIWLFISYIILSLFSTLNTRGFIVFNVVMLLYNFWLFHFIF